MSDFNTDKYWATEIDADVLLSKVKTLRKSFLETFTKSRQFERIERSFRYYHGLYYQQQASGSETKYGGSDGEFNLVACNEYRAVLSLLKTYVTSIKPDWDCMAKTGQGNVLEATIACNELLDGYMIDNECGLDRSFKQCVEDALVFSAGYMWVRWDTEKGDSVDVDSMTQRVVKTGDYQFLNPSIVDVAYDTAVRNFQDCRWVIVRQRECKWDLVEHHGVNEDTGAPDDKKKKEILENCVSTTSDEYEERAFSYLINSRQDINLEDYVWVYYFYHKPCDSLPLGRFVKYVGSYVLLEEELEDKVIPICRLMPAEFKLTGFGYTPAFDLQGPQELLNITYSTIATNVDKLGPTKLWFKAGEPINQAELEPGINVIQSETEPHALNFLKQPSDLLQGLDIHRGTIERLSGVNPTARGLPQSKMSGKALEFLEDRTEQSASDFISNFFQLMIDVGHTIVIGLKNRMGKEKGYQTIQRNGKRIRKTITKQILEGIDSVAVIIGNPLMRTPAGRVQVLNYLIGTGIIDTKEEFLTVWETGKLEVLLEANDRQLEKVHSENDDMTAVCNIPPELVGQVPDIPLPNIEDNHVLHIRKHSACIETVKGNMDAVNRIRKHNLMHHDMLKDPYTQELMVLLGYNNPLPPMGMGGPPPGGPGGPPPGGIPQQTPPGNMPGEKRGPPQPGGPPGVMPKLQ